MSAFTDYVSSITPEFCKSLVEGLVYTRLKYAKEYIDDFIYYSINSKTNTNLRYLGSEELTPKEELSFIFNKKSKITYDIVENDIALVKYLFQYGDEKEVRENYFYIPYANKGNTINLAGNKFLVMPTLANKVISIGQKAIFINIITAKYNFTRFHHAVLVNDSVELISIIEAPLYKNPAKNVSDTTKAKTTIIHYLLANYGLSKTLELLGVEGARVVYDTDEKDVIVLSSTKERPKGYIEDPELYKPTRLKFVLNKNADISHAKYVIGNVFYVLDHFPERLTIGELDKPLIWSRLMGEIIHSGNHGVSYLNEKMLAHFEDLNSPFNPITSSKLKSIKIAANTLMELLRDIFLNFNVWTLTDSPRSIYDTRSYEVETFVLSGITSNITKLMLDINKEELRTPTGKLEKKEVDDIFKKHFKSRCIFMLRKARPFSVGGLEYPGDHLYFKNTAMIIHQESDAIDPNTSDNDTAARRKLVATMSSVGSILSLNKKNPTPMIRANPYLHVHPFTGELILKPELKDILERTDKLLTNIGENDNVVDLEDSNPEVLMDDDFDEYEDDDFDYVDLDDDTIEENWD